LAVEDKLDLAIYAPDGAQQNMLRIVVRGRPTVRVRELALVVPRADQEHITHDDPAAVRAPAGLEHQRARQVTAGRRHHHLSGPEPEAPRATIQDGAKDTGRVHARQTHPLEVAAGGDQRRHLAVGEKRVVGDGWEGRDAHQVLDGGFSRTRGQAALPGPDRPTIRAGTRTRAEVRGCVVPFGPVASCQANPLLSRPLQAGYQARSGSAGPCSGAHPALAGLVPALEAHYVPLQHVVWAACRPGARPLAALAWALVQLGLPDPAEAG